MEIIAPAGVEDTLSAALLFKVRVAENGTAQVNVLDASHRNRKIAAVSDAKFPINVQTPYGVYILNKTADFPNGEKLATNIYISGYDMVAENWDKKISISIVSKKSNVIALALKETNIERGKDILNTIIEIYNKNGIIEKNLEAENAARFISDRKKIIEEELFAAEKEIEEYKKINNLTDVGLDTRLALEQNIKYQTQETGLQTQQRIVQIIEEFLLDPLNQYSLIPFASGLNDEASVSAIQQYNELIMNRMRLLRTAKESSPTVELVTEQIDATRNNVLSTIKNHQKSLDVILDNVLAQEKRFLGQIRDLPTQEKEFIRIKRQQSIKQELYIFILQKEEENAMTLAITTPKGQIIDAAYNMNKPVSLSKMVILLIGLIIGGILPMIYLYLKGLLYNKFESKEELEKLTQLPILGEICTNKTSENIVVREGRVTSIVELFKLLRTNIQFVLSGKNEKIILITSSTSGEGKSFVSSNLSASLALLNKKVLLVDMDIRNSKLKDYLGINESVMGLTNYLSTDELSVNDIILRHPVQKNMDVILSGPVPPNPAELLLSDKIDALFSELREEYDYIILDSAPVGMVADTFGVVRVSDAVIYVCRANYTEKNNIYYLNSLVEQNRLRNVSLVINATSARQGYGYGYGKTRND
ncbi:MAG: polysaccharide biosynthesis tyrosine autokinase [Coprobacter sp.]|nr:polysaccharide biosynthesis tyrosine autokinase [Coprobacter sp.]